MLVEDEEAAPPLGVVVAVPVALPEAPPDVLPETLPDAEPVVVELDELDLLAPLLPPLLPGTTTVSFFS